MPCLAVTLKNILSFSKTQSYRAWKQGIYVGVGMADTIGCPPAHRKLGFQSPGISYAEMREHTPRMRGAGLGAET